MGRCPSFSSKIRYDVSSSVFLALLPPFFTRQSALKSVFWLIVVDFILLPVVKEVISLEKALQGLLDSELECHDVEPIETLPPPFSARGIEVIVDLENVVSTEEDPNLQDVVFAGAFHKDLAPSGSSRSLRHVKRRFLFLEVSSGDSVETVCTEPPLHKNRNLSFLLGGSKGFTSSPDECPPKLL